MAVNFDARAVGNVECWTHRGESREPTPVCKSLIGAGLVLNMPNINGKKIDEWWFRIMFCKMIRWEWPYMEHDENGDPIYPSYSDLIDHTGLRILDATHVARHTWVKKMATRIENVTLSTIERSGYA